MRSARARSVSRNSAMTARGNALPSGGENAVRSIHRECIAVGMLEHFLIATHLFVARKFAPRGDLTLGRGGRWKKTDSVSRSRHQNIIAQQKRPRQNRGLRICTTPIDQRE